MKDSGQLYYRIWLYLSQENIWMTASFPPSQTVYQLFDLNEILFGPKWLSGKDIWTDVKVWTLQCFFFFLFVSVVILRHDSIKKKQACLKRSFLSKKNCIPSSHWLQAVVQICGGQCSFKTIPKKWTWWGATYSLSLIIVWYTVLFQYL